MLLKLLPGLVGCHRLQGVSAPSPETILSSAKNYSVKWKQLNCPLSKRISNTPEMEIKCLAAKVINHGSRAQEVGLITLTPAVKPLKII